MSAGSAISPVFDYTSLDYDSVQKDLQRYAQAQFGINLTNYNPSEPLVVVIGMLAYVSDLLAYSENQHTQEGIPVRAIRMANFRDGVKPLGFSPKGPTPATAPLVVTFDPAEIAAHSITITPAHKVNTSSRVMFQPTVTTVFPMGGATTGEIEVQQGETFHEVLAAAAPGTPSQSYNLSQYPVLESSVHVYVDGIEWTEAPESVAIEGPTSQTYDIHYDADWKARIVFGDGANGSFPTAGLEVAVDYTTCIGSSGTVAKDTITNVVSMPTGVESVTNPLDSTPGDDPETLDSAKARLPGVARANDRAVSFADYAAEATNVTGISKATAVKGKHGTGGCGCPVVIYAAPPGGGALTPYLRSQVVLHLRTQGMTGRRIFVRDATYVPLTIELDVHVSPQASASDTRVLVQNEVLDTYDFSSLGFGVTLPIQSLYDLLTPASVKGVVRVYVRKFSVLPTMGYYIQQTPTGNGTVENASALTNAVRREWKITITSAGGSTGPATFDMTIRVLGRVTEVSDSSVIDESSRFEPNTLTLFGWVFRYRPYDSDTGTFPILGNTETGISLDTSSAALQDYIQPQEEFCVELEATSYPGKCYRDSWTIPVGPGTPLGIVVTAPGSGWAVNDPVHVVSSTGADFYTNITGGTPGAWEVDVSVPAFPAGTTMTMTAVWSDNEELRFELVQGSRRWMVGDTFYVDNYPLTADLVIRDQAYPELSAENLVIRTIGGRT